jgi:hypothetical protein
MKIKDLFPKFNVPVRLSSSIPYYGQYWDNKDMIILNPRLMKKLPGCAKFIFLHEMIHSTAHGKRLMRFQRLENNFGEYTVGSMAHKTEECIAEVASMVAAMKLGLLNEYSQNIIFQGLEQHYSKGMYIPVREIRAAVMYFAKDGVSFEEEIQEVKFILESHMDIKFQDTYNKRESA